ncbi:MAG TPA: DNA-3-methyladenine glycosylase I [Anaerolineales bacterium]|nr:DNA-3-methyladenine glycosylase I [Anaerolineales bacterium]
MTELRRCWGSGDSLMAAYHDQEWGVPVRDDALLYQHLVLDGFQAGLSWRTILYKRENFRRAFEGFDPERVAAYGKRDVARLMRDAGIVRNRQKIEAAIDNARAYLALIERDGSFTDFLWSFTGGKTKLGKAARRWQDIPTHTPESDAMAKALQAHGFRFAGTTICYAFMQAVGMVDDHMVGCFRYQSRRPRRS